MKMGLDGFRRVAQEGKITTLKHPAGHEIRINHSILSPKMRGELAALPQHEEAQEPKKFAEGGKAEYEAKVLPPQDYKDQETEVDYRKENEDARKASDAAPETQVQDEAVKEGLPIDQPAQSAEQPQVQASSPPAMPQQDQQHPIASIVDSHNKAMGAHQAFMNSIASMNQPQQAPAQNNVPPVSQGVNPRNLVGSAISNEAQGEQAERGLADVQGQEQTKEAGVRGEEAQSQQSSIQRLEDLGAQYHQKYDALANDIAMKKIDPSHWWNDKSTGSKIATAVGMLFAGAGLGASGHPELASKAIDDAINRDIDAQKNDISNKQNLLSKYTEQYHSSILGEDALRLHYAAAAEGLIKQAAAQAGSQGAQLAASKAIADRRQGVVNNLENLTKGQYMTQIYGDNSSNPSSNPAGANSEQQFQKHLGQMRMINPDIGKDLESRYVPGVGVAGKPLPVEAQERIIASKNLSDRLAELENFSREHQGTVLDRATVNRGKTLAKAVQGAYRQATHGGVFKESEANFISKIVPDDPTAFYAKLRTLPQYQETREINNAELQNTMKGYGIQPFSQGAQVVQRGYNPKTNQTQLVYSNGQKQIVEGRQ